METITISRDAITDVAIPVVSVLHLTETTLGKTIIIGKSLWFTTDEARKHAFLQSACYPKPNRFAIYDAKRKWVASYQCGKSLPMFLIS